MAETPERKVVYTRHVLAVKDLKIEAAYYIDKLGFDRDFTAQPAVPSPTRGQTRLRQAEPAWFDIPYHYYIASDGRIADGRPIKYAGDTNTEYDPTGHALVVLEGSFNTEQPTPTQIESLKQMVAWLTRKYKIPSRTSKDTAITQRPPAQGKI